MTTWSCIMWLTIKDTGGFQLNKTLVRPEGPNVAASGKRSRVSLDLSWPRAEGPTAKPTCLVWPKASLRALYPSHES